MPIISSGLKYQWISTENLQKRPTQIDDYLSKYICMSQRDVLLILNYNIKHKTWCVNNQDEIILAFFGM